MIAVDTNILVYAHRADSEWHVPAAAAIRKLARGPEAWAIPWPCAHEFLAVATHPAIYDPPSTLGAALRQLAIWRRAPGMTFLAESAGYAEQLSHQVEAAGAVGPLVHDARVVALCLHHGVTELWSSDRDFGRFPQLRVHNPIVGG